MAENEAENQSLTVTVPSKVEDDSGFPRTASSKNFTKETKGSGDPNLLSPKKTVQAINIYTFRLYQCFKLQIVVFLVAIIIEVFYARWEIIASIVCGILSILVGWYGAHNRSICCLQIFSVIETCGFLFSFFGTAIIYWIIINYNSFCNSALTEKTNCIPKIVFILSAASAPILFALLLLGGRLGYKLLILHKHLNYAFTVNKGYIVNNTNNSNSINTNRASIETKEALLLNDKNLNAISINNDNGTKKLYPNLTKNYQSNDTFSSAK